MKGNYNGLSMFNFNIKLTNMFSKVLSLHDTGKAISFLLMGASVVSRIDSVYVSVRYTLTTDGRLRPTYCDDG